MLSMLLKQILQSSNIDDMSNNVDIARMATIIVRDIDEELRKELRIICLLNGVSMNAQIKELIAAFVKENRKKR